MGQNTLYCIEMTKIICSFPNLYCFRYCLWQRVYPETEENRRSLFTFTLAPLSWRTSSTTTTGQQLTEDLVFFFHGYFVRKLIITIQYMMEEQQCQPTIFLVKPFTSNMVLLLKIEVMPYHRDLTFYTFVIIFTNFKNYFPLFGENSII